jgi:hypothetical protein
VFERVAGSGAVSEIAAADRRAAGTLVEGLKDANKEADK